jgi:hypothetical protein
MEREMLMCIHVESVSVQLGASCVVIRDQGHAQLLHE